jgi:hypothetical protein
MTKIGFLVIALTALVLMVVSVWRERRSERWRSLGLCYQCGAALGLDAKPVTLRFKAPSPAKVVDFCGGCAKERTIRRWLMAALMALALIVGWFVHQA